MAVKTFGSERLVSTDINTYLANSGLVYVTEATVTSGSTYNLPNCFSATYDSYRVVISDARGTAAIGVQLRFSVAGTPTSTGYYYSQHDMIYGATTTYNQRGGVNVTSINDILVLDGSTAGATAFDVFDPFKTNKTIFVGTRTDPRTTGTVGANIGYLNNNTSYDGMYFNTSSDSWTNMKIRVYGYRQA